MISGQERGVEQHQYLIELKKFLDFLRSLWRLLAGISVLFPLSNQLVQVIPAAGGDRPFKDLSPGLVTTMTTVACLFTTFAVFARREEFGRSDTRRRLGRRASIWFGLGVVALTLYILLPNGLYQILVSRPEGAEFNVALYDGIFGLLYGCFFVFLTRAFLILALLEYKSEEPQNASDGSAESGVQATPDKGAPLLPPDGVADAGKVDRSLWQGRAEVLLQPPRDEAESGEGGDDQLAGGLQQWRELDADAAQPVQQRPDHGRQPPARCCRTRSDPCRGGRVRWRVGVRLSRQAGGFPVHTEGRGRVEYPAGLAELTGTTSGEGVDDPGGDRRSWNLCRPPRPGRWQT